MCGIGGLSFESKVIGERLNRALSHRGPDDAGLFVEQGVTLAHRRLSIIDLSPGGHQPMHSTDDAPGLTIVFNGEIYNYLELRAELRDYPFRTHSDTEVILAAYRQWGEDCVNRFNGMWTICIFDTQAKRLFLSRDRFGVKPLYYLHAGGELAFASEIKALREVDGMWRATINSRAAFDYAMFNAIDWHDETFFEHVHRLEPGTNLTFDLRTRSLATKRYYSIPEFDSGATPATSDAVAALFQDSVRLRLRSDVPVGASLSGGIDSSSIVSTIHRQFGTSTQLETFSIVFPGTPVDESRYIDAVIGATDSVYNKVEPTLPMLLDDLEDFVWTQDEPVRTTSMYAHYQLMRRVSEKKIKVLLEGQGADELLAGYVPWAPAYRVIDAMARGQAAEVWHEFRASKNRYAEPSLRFVKHIVKQVALDSQLAKHGYIQLNQRHLDARFSGANAHDSAVFHMSTPKRIGRALRERFAFGLSALLRYGDKNSMRFGVETRFPFLDYRLVQYVFSSFRPTDWVRDGRTKFVFREAMRGTTPSVILDRDDKIGFETPQKAWFKDARMIALLREVTSTQDFRQRGVFNPARVDRMIDEASRGRDHNDLLWRVLNFELWARRHGARL